MLSKQLFIANSMKNNQFLKRFLSLKFILGLVIGAALGYAYFYFIGCKGGSCPLWASPWRSTLVGMVFGGVLMFDGSTKNKKDESKADPEQQE